MINTQQVTGAWNQIRGKVKEKWGQLTDDDLRIVGGNVEQLIGRIQQRTGEAREAIEEFINDAMATPVSRAAEAAKGYAQDAAVMAKQTYQDAEQAARQTYQRASEQAQAGYESAREVVRTRPATSMATVFATGMLAGVVVGLLLKSE